MPNSNLNFVFVQCLIAGSALIFLLFKKQTAYLGVTFAFLFSVTSASLSAFFFGHIFGLREQWITTYHEQVLAYSGWMALAMVGALWLAWLPIRRARGTLEKGDNEKDKTFEWLTPQFIYFTVGLGVVATLVTPFVFKQIATVSTAVNLMTGWLKVSLILAVVLFKKKRAVQPLLITLVIFIPAAAIHALGSGFSPVSLDVVIPIVFVAAFLDRVTLLSFVKLAVAMVPVFYLMIGWLASRNMIRSGDLDEMPLVDRAAHFADAFVYEVTKAEITPDDIQNIIFDRIDMSDILAQEVGFEDSSSGEDQFRYGGTLVDGAYALVPRAIWEDKPVVAGYAEFVGEYTGTSRSDDTAVGVPEQFELYANGGALAVIFGMFLLTYICARLERFVATGRRALHVVMPCIMFLVSFSFGIEQIMLVLASAVAGAGTSWMIAKVIETFFPRFLSSFRVGTKRRRWFGRKPTLLPAT